MYVNFVLWFENRIYGAFVYILSMYNEIKIGYNLYLFTEKYKIGKRVVGADYYVP